MTRRLILACLTILTLVASPFALTLFGAAAPAPTYTVTADLGLVESGPGNPWVVDAFPIDPSLTINSAAQVAGTGRYPDPGNEGSSTHARRWANGTIVLLDDRDFIDSASQGINNLGDVVGWVDSDSPPGTIHAFFWNSTTGMTDLGTLPGGASGDSVAYGVNNAGQVVGTSAVGPGDPDGGPAPMHAFLWQDADDDGVSDPGEMIDLCTPPGPIILEVPVEDCSFAYSVAYAINAAGVVVGEYDRPDFGARAFLWRDVNGNGASDPGEMIDLGFTSSSAAYDINDNGQVVGRYISNDRDSAFLWQNGQVTELVAPPGSNSVSAVRINNAGQVLGTFGFPFGSYGIEHRPFLWQDGTWIALDDLIPDNPPWRIADADAFSDEGTSYRLVYDINDAGQIVGVAEETNGVRHVVLLTPIRTVALTPASLTFAATTVDSTSPAQQATLTNTGPNPVSIASIATSGNFAQTNTCGTILAVGASCVIDVTFTPTAAGTRTGVLTVVDNAAGSPHTVSLSGTGAATYTLTLTSGTGGSAVASPPGPTYPAGSVVQLTATPDTSRGYSFVGWVVNGAFAGTANPLPLTMNADYSVAAVFGRPTAGYGLILGSTPGGSASASAPGPGAVVELTAAPDPGYVFTGWTVDGVFEGWRTPLTLTMDTNHTVLASFAAVPGFPDVTPGNPAYEAIAQLAARGIIRGYEDGRFGPNDATKRAQMAALIARAMGWDKEDHGNRFPDRGSVDADLWRNVGTLAYYNVARGYPDGTYKPTAEVLHAQVASFIARAMVAKGYWQAQPDDPALYPNVPATSGHRADIATFVYYAGPFPGAPDTTAAWGGWNQPASRAWFAQALWRALDSYFDADRVD
jgi:uncharacterized repeat protein (TIGR02543 family)